MLLYHALFLLLLVGSTAFFAALAVLDVRHADRTVRERADWLADTIGVDDPDRLLAYHRLTTATNQLESIVVLGVVLLLLYTGAFAEAVAVVLGLLTNDLLAGVLVFVGATVALQLISAPFDALSTFGVEEAFDFNQQSPALFVRDKLVGTAVAVVLVGLVGGAILYTVQAVPDYWWLAATGVVVAFMVISQVLVPRVIMPLFYDFEPIEDGSLRDAIEDVFERAGFSCEQIYVMDASSRSSHSNAFFSGFGRTKRVVLFDTLIDQMDEREMQSVLAHELAHWKKAHIWKFLGAGAIRVLVLFLVLQYLVESTWLYAMFGVPQHPAAGLLLATLWVQPIDRFLRPLRNRLSLRFEWEADAFAKDVMGNGDPLADALANLTSENLANPFPHPLYETFHYTHPPVPERIRALTDDESPGAASDTGTPNTAA